MAVLDTKTKRKLGLKAFRTMARHPKATRKAVQVAGPPVYKAAKPIAKRRMRRKVQRAGDTARVIGETLATHGPEAARELGLVERPKEKRTAPRVVAGVVIGASAVYFLEPEHGKKRRERVASLVA